MRPKTLTIGACELSKPFIRTLSTLTDKSVTFLQLGMTRHDTLTFTDVFLAFPHIQKLDAYGIIPTPTWMSDILKAQKTKLSWLTMTDAYGIIPTPTWMSDILKAQTTKLSWLTMTGTAKQFGDFTLHDLTSFIQAQNLDFMVVFRIEVTGATYADKQEGRQYYDKLNVMSEKLPPGSCRVLSGCC
uniref:Glucuronosyltransferase n=1 Tax=Panagrellus redivivus TaxID=6233 RepID=A0A7E4ZT12_PANRE